MKTLVELLREMIEMANENETCPAVFATPIVGHSVSTRDDDIQLFTTIADRIEKEYMPLPLDADGVPINIGDTVFYVNNAEAFDVLGLEIGGDETVHIGRKDGTSTDAWVSTDDLTHNQPDTMERIEEDARKSGPCYWGCVGAWCNNCPAMVDGEKPWVHYKTGGDCDAAQKLDLLRRQREVLERGNDGN